MSNNFNYVECSIHQDLTIDAFRALRARPHRNFFQRLLGL